MEMRKPKFKVGDWVDVLRPPKTSTFFPVTKVRILEVATQLCEADTLQTTYRVRLWIEGRPMLGPEMQVREMELGELATPAV